MEKQERRAPEEMIIRLFLDLYRNGKQDMKTLTRKYGATWHQMQRYIDHLSMVVPICEERTKEGYRYYLMSDYEIRRGRE